MKIKKIISAVAALTIAVAASSCTGDSTGDSIKKITLPDYDAYESEYQTVISGWLIPSSLNEDNVKWITEAGISVMHAIDSGKNASLFFTDYTDDAKEKLDLLNENGIKVYINTNSRDGSSYRKIENFKQSEAVLGMSLDEPNMAEISSMAAQVAWWNQNSDGRIFYCNLYPSFSRVVQNEFSGNYASYLNYYCENVLDNLTAGEKWLSADRYPLTYDDDGNKCLDSAWLSDIQILKNTAKSRKGVKTNFFIQTMPYGINEDGSPSGAIFNSRDRVPSYEDIRMQEYSLAAFGYDGISLFCYGTPAIGFEFAESQQAMIDRNGEKTDIYTAVSKANAEILAFDHVLAQFDWVGTFTNDAGQTNTDKSRTGNSSFKLLQRMSLNGIPSLKSVTTSADTLFGYFNDIDGNDGIMVVNYNETSLKLTDKVELNFDETKYNKALCYIAGKKTVVNLKNGKFELELGIGEGVFVIPYAE